MAGKIKTVAVETPVVETVVEETVATPLRDSVTVVWRAGSRTYTRAEHGEDFEALATGFAEKKNGTLV